MMILRSSRRTLGRWLAFLGELPACAPNARQVKRFSEIIGGVAGPWRTSWPVLKDDMRAPE
jgi:hypothetical protein